VNLERVCGGVKCARARCVDSGGRRGYPASRSREPAGGGLAQEGIFPVVREFSRS
jgi:hypothetical protein